MTESPFDGLAVLLPPKAEQSEPSEMEAFERWLKHANPGSEYVYATGVVRLDEVRRQKPVLSEETWAVAKAAWKAYEQGRVELAQRRNENGFDYLCQKRREAIRNDWCGC